MRGFKHHYLAAVGDSNDPATWSGIPYHIIKNAQAAGFDLKGLVFDIAPRAAMLKRAIWTAGRLMRGRRPRGYQYSQQFLEGLWSTCQAPSGSMLINCSQIFPDSVFGQAAYGKAFFLDQTLEQLFEYYGHKTGVAPDLRGQAQKIEKKQYASADVVIMQSEWARQSVLIDYGIAPKQVHVVLPGANYEPDVLDTWEGQQGGPREVRHHRPVVFGFVGKEWERKGLDRLIRALRIVTSRGVRVQLRIIGCLPEQLPAELVGDAWIEWLGFVNKRHEPRRFLELLADFDVGCLLSRREAGGVSLCEFARLGLPTVAPYTGGAPELTVAGATTLIPPAADDAEIAAFLEALATNRAFLNEQKAIAWAGRAKADWRRAVRELQAIFEPH